MHVDESFNNIKTYNGSFAALQVDEAFLSNINRIYYWHIDNWEDFLYHGAVPQVPVITT